MNGSIRHLFCPTSVKIRWIASLWILTSTPAVWADRPPMDPAKGQSAYAQSCARCHGVDGRGDGVDAKRFYPRPRDFTRGIYKFRSTASGTPPTDEDLYQSITHGLPGTNMPDWQHLDESTRWHLVDYLKSLSEVFTQTQPELVARTVDPGADKADRAKGKTLYDQLGCAACHGQNGRANGPSAAGLVDDWGMPIRPANLTQGWNYRGGASARDVMLRVLTGVDGAGMPSYTGAVSPEDAWLLAYYVTQLQEPAHWYPISSAYPFEGELPQTVDDPRWNHAERTDLRLRQTVSSTGEWTLAPTVNAVSIQLAYNEQAVAIRCAWDDPTQNPDSSAGIPDALAIVFKPSGSRGDTVSLQAWPLAESQPLDIVYWQASTPLGQAKEMIATNFDQLLASKLKQVSLQSAATYEQGRWQLLIRRPRVRDDLPHATRLSPDDSMSFGIVIWDASEAGSRAVSAWQEVRYAESHP